jgi:hypothetical protein
MLELSSSVPIISRAYQAAPRDSTSAVRKVWFPLEFLRKLFAKFGGNKNLPSSDDPRGAAPLQSQEEQDATRHRMEAEMDKQRESRDAPKTEQ